MTLGAVRALDPSIIGGVRVQVGGSTVQPAGQTPGMRLVNIRVSPGRSDRQLTAARALVRTVGLALAIIPCFLGFLPALFDSRRRALPDYLAGTVVLYDDDGAADRGRR